MIMNSKHSLVLGYELDTWNDHGYKVPICIDISPKTNSQILVCGMSGSGKSYFENQLFSKLIAAEQSHAEFGSGEYHFADFKSDDSFSYLHDCPHYYAYKDAFRALDIVHSRLSARQSGEDTTRHPVTLIWDEYMAAILALTSEDKKAAAVVMNKVSEILLLGRSLSVRIYISCQRADALAFPAGSRLNYGVVVILGAAIRSIYEMLMPDFLGDVQGRKFGQGEGVVLLQGSELHFIKIPTVRDMERMRQLCIGALS